MSMFSNRLEGLRTQKGWTKTYTGKQLGLALTTYANYEYGEREPDFEMLKQIATLFDTSTDYLTGKTDDPTPISTSDNEEGNPDVDLSQDHAYSYHGYPIPDKYMKMVKGLMEEDIKDGKVSRHE